MSLHGNALFPSSPLLSSITLNFVRTDGRPTPTPGANMRHTSEPNGFYFDIAAPRYKCRPQFVTSFFSFLPTMWRMHQLLLSSIKKSMTFILYSIDCILLSWLYAIERISIQFVALLLNHHSYGDRIFLKNNIISEWTHSLNNTFYNITIYEFNSTQPNDPMPEILLHPISSESVNAIILYVLW